MNKIIGIVAIAGAGFVFAGSMAAAQQMHDGKHHRGQRFERLDANNDGSLSSEEFLAGATGRFDKADANSDGVLTEDELVERIMRRKAERRAARMMKRMDYNGDGKVTKDEIESRAKKRFALMDGNDDGKIEKSEMRRNGFRRKGMRKHRRHGERRHRRGMGNN